MNHYLLDDVYEYIHDYYKDIHKNKFTRCLIDMIIRVNYVQYATRPGIGGLRYST